MRIGLFIPCYVDAFYAEVAVATLELLESLEHEASYPREQVVPLDTKDIVPTLHEVYGGRLDLTITSYGVFMAGPSATGDIEGLIIHGAQSARSLTVLLLDELSTITA